MIKRPHNFKPPRNIPRVVFGSASAKAAYNGHRAAARVRSSLSCLFRLRPLSKGACWRTENAKAMRSRPKNVFGRDRGFYRIWIDRPQGNGLRAAKIVPPRPGHPQIGHFILVKHSPRAAPCRLRG
jgi:hypothetical protein